MTTGVVMERLIAALTYFSAIRFKIASIAFDPKPLLFDKFFIDIDAHLCACFSGLTLPDSQKFLVILAVFRLGVL